MDPHHGQPVISEGAPLGQGRAVVIMVHGRGASPEAILSLVPRLARPEVTWLAPAAASNSWYPYSFLSDTEKNEPFLSSALASLGRVVDDLGARGIARRNIVFLGFSQGACLSSEFLVRNPGKWGGLVVLSGGLIGPPGTIWPESGSFDHMPAFFGCSDVDSHIPRARVEESAAVFERMGATVTVRLYAGMGHVVNEDEIAYAKAVIDHASEPR